MNISREGLTMYQHRLGYAVETFTIVTGFSTIVPTRRIWHLPCRSNPLLAVTAVQESTSGILRLAGSVSEVSESGVSASAANGTE